MDTGDRLGTDYSWVCTGLERDGRMELSMDTSGQNELHRYWHREYIVHTYYGRIYTVYTSRWREYILLSGVSILQYRVDFTYFCRMSHMYRLRCRVEIILIIAKVVV